MWDRIQQVWKVKDVRNNILFVVALLVIFRLVAHIPIPGVNLANLRNYLAGNQILGLLNIFSGGTMQNFSIVMLGVGPYITASIIFQLLGMIVPSLEEMSKEGEAGQQKINMYTRWLSVPLAFLQSFAMIKLLNQSSSPILTNLTTFRLITIMLTITAGTMFLVWIGELISEKKVGNVISLLIFAGIVASLPTSLRTTFLNYDPSQLFTYVLFAAAAILTVVGVVFISEGQRNIPVSYAKQVRGNQIYGGSTTHLPFRVNMAGVIPIIFAVSLMLFPSMISQFFVHANAAWMRDLANGTVRLFQNQVFYNILYFLLVFGFTYFYTAVIFHPQKIAENLQKQGGFIPGIRPGKETELYLASTMNRINLIGALFLGAIAILPLVAQSIAGTQSLTIGGTSLLIVVAVAIETAKQIEAQLTMHQYDQI
ncbi:MAG: preprotein translocase subunit SecY [Candidatus Magasanikbacteria bacterium RIFCSPHIGHO2_01_FULL_47_8]|uniref:Protein translocase subunit SecY n=1 Tax=Candidatus Magasanikbacteria bacterium RIFCSPHIGHO2_01_FULL_47_8 TaxID=1798673 RepID=A0A1F6MCY5_9BACT|nr:MAG: preprotein translocase subunit SecY [Candidatus Magasanikbacteria bacterium RIFCSPHIGHO2_01_FULL_47_8]